MKKKIQIIINESVSDTIKKNDTIKVKRGYAFNYLIPNKLAEVATKKKVKHLEIIKSIENTKQEKESYKSEKIKTILENIQNIYVNKKIGDNYAIFGSIVEKDIIKKTTQYTNINIEKKQMQMPVMKKVSINKVKINLYGYKDLSVNMQLIILPQNL